MVELNPVTDRVEYSFVEAEFRKGGLGEACAGVAPAGEFPNRILKIQRIQNSLLWEKYYSTRAEAKRRNGDPNEL